MQLFIKSATTIAVLVSLAACGGSDTGVTEQAANTPEIPDVCDTELHNQIRGSYNGQILFSSPEWVTEPKSCDWDVSLSVATTSDANDLCQISFDMETQIQSGSTDCKDITTSGDLYSDNALDEDAPQWPTILSAVTAMDMELYSIYATGNSSNDGRWEYVLDGLGNIGLDEVSEAIGYAGVLVRFSDQPNAIDKGLVSGLRDQNDY